MEGLYIIPTAKQLEVFCLLSLALAGIPMQVVPVLSRRKYGAQEQV